MQGKEGPEEIDAKLTLGYKHWDRVKKRCLMVGRRGV
jgi:hypothetical protein